MESPLEVYMKKAEIEEKVKETLKNITAMSFKHILSYAIKGEKDATDLYQYLYETLPEGYSKKRFKRFIWMEKSHDKKLIDIFTALYPDEEPPDVPFESWRKIFEEREFKLKNVKDYLDILEIAMEAEKLAREIYLFLAKNTDNVEHRRIFLELAKDEEDHYDFVKKEYEIYSKAKAEEDLKELIKELMENRKAHSAGA
ncbi:ferritin-like domain-containing protein [Thermococcus barophilus]|uniref:Rubrerythrin n=1 Tax=Thermococcus barophilus TaxID=55802 RepID=A0A0S1X9C1_THEBA|nr:ferritin family protein [Thermococcus barophilus]ALM74398.1 Rubrerythrin [Thermococcus barophilus]